MRLCDETGKVCIPLVVLNKQGQVMIPFKGKFSPNDGFYARLPCSLEECAGVIEPVVIRDGERGHFKRSSLVNEFLCPGCAVEKRKV